MVRATRGLTQQREARLPPWGGCLRLWQNGKKQAGGRPFCLPAQAEAQATGRVAGQHWVNDCWLNSQGKRQQSVSRWPEAVGWRGRAVAWRGPDVERAARPRFSRVTICEHAHLLSANAQTSR